MTIWRSLPCVSLSVTHRTRHTWIERVVVDTGSAKELGAVHIFDQVGVEDEIAITPFVAHVGAANYGNDLGGLLGLDFLRRAGAIVNLHDWTIEFTAGAVQSPQ